MRLSWLEASLRRLELPVLDEVGFVSFSRVGAEMLFGLLSERYRAWLRCSSPTNLDFASCGDARFTGALLYRLTHRCHILEFRGDSYRFKKSLHRHSPLTPVSGQQVGAFSFIAVGDFLVDEQSSGERRA